MPSPTGGDGTPVDPMKPASTSPMNRMNAPIPAVIASLSSIGTASKISLRRPVAARITMMMPLMTTRPIASGQVSEPTTVVARNELMPRPAANANGSRANQAEQDRHDACGKRCRGGDLREVQAVSVDVLRVRQDDRVQHDDVGHRDERDDAAADLGCERRSTRRQLEEAVEAARACLLLASAVMSRP